MPICKICRKPVTSGVVVHSECYEELNNFDNTQSKLLLIKISELRKENAELKARFEKAVELPCEMGDKIYRKGRFSDKIIETTISEIIINRFGFTFKTESKTSTFCFNDDEIGNKIYLTREAAEQALKEREEK